MSHFFRNYDGVHVLLNDRSEVGRYFIPERGNARDGSNIIPSDYTPAHFYHNWRFNNVYAKKDGEKVE